jgi:hypothetical protein
VVRSHVLTTGGTTRDMCGGVTWRIADRWMIGAIEIRLLTPKHQLLSSWKNKRSGSHTNDRQLHMQTKRTPAGKTRGRPSWMGASFPRDSMRTAPPLWPWHPRRPARMTESTKPQIGKLFSSTQAQHSSPMSHEKLKWQFIVSKIT